MNTRTFALIALAIALIAAALVTARLAVVPPQGEAPEAPQGAAPAEDRKVSDEGDYHRIEAVTPGSTPLQGEANAAAVAAMEGFVMAEIATFKRESGLETLTEEDIEMMGLGGDRKYELKIEYDAYESHGTVSYVFPIYANTMGAHPNAYYRTFTFDKQTGAELRIGDLFESDAYLEALSSGSRVQITARLGEENANKEYLESGTTPDAPNFQHFYLDKNDLVIIFPPYQVGPWVIGTQEARFPVADFDLMKHAYR